MSLEVQMLPSETRHAGFSRFAWGVLGYNLLVILWGAWVRITGSGAGCGEHWPTCNGEVIPQAQSTATLIEFTHRITSGISLPLTIALLVGAFRYYPKGSLTRSSAVGALIFLLSEALLGAGLVLLGLVADNDSGLRAVVVSMHLINTMALIGFGAIVAWSSTKKVRLDLSSPALRWLYVALVGLLLSSMAGAITALGDTLFPVDEARSLVSRLGEELSATSHFLVRLRIVHPILAVLVGLLLWLVCARWREDEGGPTAARWAWIVSALVLVQLLAGVVNISLAAPGWMQLIHLLLADLLWISALLLCAEISAREP